MRPIDETLFVDYTIAGNGWTYTVESLPKAVAKFKEMETGILYGNKPDGTRAIIDSKQ